MSSAYSKSKRGVRLCVGVRKGGAYFEVSCLDIGEKDSHEQNKQVRGKRAALANTGGLGVSFRNVILHLNKESGVRVDSLYGPDVKLRKAQTPERKHETSPRDPVESLLPIQKQEVKGRICVSKKVLEAEGKVKRGPRRLALSEAELPRAYPVVHRGRDAGMKESGVKLI